eukprot:4308947-Pyramimonas_sp.AAC.2
MIIERCAILVEPHGRGMSGAERFGKGQLEPHADGRRRGRRWGGRQGEATGGQGNRRDRRGRERKSRQRPTWFSFLPAGASMGVVCIHRP